MAEWSFITNHGRVLAYIYRHPKSTAREIATSIGVTERTTHKIISDLASSGYLAIKKKGRRNIYKVEPGLPMVSETNREVIVGELLHVVAPKRRGLITKRNHLMHMNGNGNGKIGQMKLLID